MCSPFLKTFQRDSLDTPTTSVGNSSYIAVMLPK
nr:MAG TPA: hypothetical protein [Caudoviricetes sp.]